MRSCLSFLCFYTIRKWSIVACVKRDGFPNGKRHYPLFTDGTPVGRGMSAKRLGFQISDNVAGKFRCLVEPV